jgi:hypothetical protein
VGERKARVKGKIEDGEWGGKEGNKIGRKERERGIGGKVKDRGEGRIRK